MILFCGIPSEPPLEYAIAAAEKAGARYVIFNQRESHFSDIAFDVEAGDIKGTIRLREKNWDLNEFKGVYIRLMEWNHLPENTSPRHGASDLKRVEKSRFFHEALVQWIEMSGLKVLNRPSDMASNMSKPYQAQLIRKSGFRTPVTLITNDPVAVESFMSEHKRIIYKSISSIRSIVRELQQNDLKNLGKVRHLPTQFQAFVTGTNVRVHVVGDSVFATRINTKAVDYRYASRDGQDVIMQPVELPDEISHRCVRLSKMLNLPLCGIDLKVTPEGIYYCFEVNPSPAYTYYEEQTGQPIARAIIDYMADGAGKR